MNTVFASQRARIRIWILGTLAFVLMVCGCGSSSDSPLLATLTTGDSEAPTVVVEPNQQLATAPHLFDVYRATNADKAVLFLHGFTGTKHNLAYELGINLNRGLDYSGVNERTLLDQKVVAVFPQGMAQTEDGIKWAWFTWDNYSMISGQDDVKFISDLVGHVKAAYHVAKVYIAGYGDGGTMVNRIWCEKPELFDGYVAIAGPLSDQFITSGPSCSPAEVKPYLGIVGSQDEVLQVSAGNWEAKTWSIAADMYALVGDTYYRNPSLIGERYFLPERVMMRCGGTVGAGESEAVTEGAVTTWSYCADSIRLLKVGAGGHELDSLEAAAGQNMINFVFDFVK
jgi:poly(3-hydroxybutyrate) depolymerase